MGTIRARGCLQKGPAFIIEIAKEVLRSSPKVRRGKGGGITHT